MKKHFIYYLKTLPNARFHFGEVSKESSLSSSSTYAYSDTLFGAILHNAFILNQEKATHLLEEMNAGKIAISSAFFYIKKEKSEKIVFLPKPVIYDTYQILDDSIDPKKIKKVEMISKGVWESGYSPEDWFNTKKCRSLQKGKFIYLKEEGDFDENTAIYTKSVTPKVPISYVNNEDDKRTIYYQSDVFLNESEEFLSGYFFLLKHDVNEKVMSFLDESIQLSTTLGLGGDRSTGAGHIFSIDKQSFEWKHNSDYKSYCNLSLLIPKHKDRYRKGRYKVITRGGQSLSDTKRLKYIQCIADGGVFPKELEGELVAIGPNRLKNGIPYFAPFNAKDFDL